MSDTDVRSTEDETDRESVSSTGAVRYIDIVSYLLPEDTMRKKLGDLIQVLQKNFQPNKFRQL